jgi:hypothetical protein
LFGPGCDPSWQVKLLGQVPPPTLLQLEVLLPPEPVAPPEPVSPQGYAVY